MLYEQPPEMTFANAEAFRERLDAGIVTVERAVANQGKRAGNRIRGSAPGGQVRRRFRPAAQAGTKSGFLRCRRGTEEAAVFRFRRARGAHRPAVDPGRGNADEQQAVKAGIAALQGAITSFLIGQLHMEILSTIETPGWRFSDIDIFVWRRQRSRAPRTSSSEVTLRQGTGFAAWTSLPVPSQAAHREHHPPKLPFGKGQASPSQGAPFAAWTSLPVPVKPRTANIILRSYPSAGDRLRRPRRAFRRVDVVPCPLFKPRTANIILRSYPSAGTGSPSQGAAFAAWTSLPVPSQTVHQLDFFPGDG